MTKMTKFDAYVEKIAARRYEERIDVLNEQLLISVSTRSREEIVAELDAALLDIAPRRAQIAADVGRLQLL